MEQTSLGAVLHPLPYWMSPEGCGRGGDPARSSDAQVAAVLPSYPGEGTSGIQAGRDLGPVCTKLC